MKSLYEKYQSNKNLFIIPLLIFVFALYFVPIIIQFPYSDETLELGLSVYGDFIGLTKISANWYVIPIIALLFAIISLIFAVLAYKNLYFAIGTSVISLWHIIYISLSISSFYADPYRINAIRTLEKVYISFSFMCAICFLVYSLFLFVLPLLANSKPHKPTKTERIADLEKQVAELQSKLPSEND